MRVRGTNNFGWAVKDELCKRIQHCCATLRRSWNKRNVGSCWLKSLTGSNFVQHFPTTCNRVCKRTGHVTSNKVGRCWPTMLRPFPRGFKRSFTCISGHLGPGLPNSSIRIPSNFHLLALLRSRLYGENLSRGVPGRWVDLLAESTLASVYMRKHSCMLWLSNTALATGWASQSVYVWRKVGKGRRVTVTLLGEPIFCCCSCKQFATFCKEIYERVAWVGRWPFSQGQHFPTTCNRVCKQTEHVTSNKVGRCWPTMLSPFPRGFKRSFTCISGHLGPGLPNSSIRIPSNFHLLALLRSRFVRKYTKG